MEPYQAKIIANLQTFIKSVAAKNITARYAVVAFGGIPELIKPFDSDVPSTLSALNKVGTKRSGWEAGLEAIRVVIDQSTDGAKGAFLKKTICLQSYSKSQCVLNWQLQKRAIIFASDEDSDIPTLTQYYTEGMQRMNALCAQAYSYDSKTSTYTCSKDYTFEPVWYPRTFDINNSGKTKIAQFMRPSKNPVTLDAPFINEIAVTAKMLASTGTYLAMLMKEDFNAAWQNNPVSSWNKYNDLYNVAAKKPGVNPADLEMDYYHTSVYQYGDPRANIMGSDFKNFDDRATLQRLISKGLATSLQAQVLTNNGMMRLFSIADMIVPEIGDKMTQNFYEVVANMSQTIVNSNWVCVDLPKPTTTASPSPSFSGMINPSDVVVIVDSTTTMQSSSAIVVAAGTSTTVQVTTTTVDPSPTEYDDEEEFIETSDSISSSITTTDSESTTATSDSPSPEVMSPTTDSETAATSDSPSPDVMSPTTSSTTIDSPSPVATSVAAETSVTESPADATSTEEGTTVTEQATATQENTTSSVDQASTDEETSSAAELIVETTTEWSVTTTEQATTTQEVATTSDEQTATDSATTDELITAGPTSETTTEVKVLRRKALRGCQLKMGAVKKAAQRR
jgi:hypothetical protein